MKRIEKSHRIKIYADEYTKYIIFIIYYF